jgi:cytochrome c oxidase subunit 3
MLYNPRSFADLRLRYASLLRRNAVQEIQVSHDLDFSSAPITYFAGLLAFFDLRHKFHLLSPSPWPFYTSLALFSLMLNTIRVLHFTGGAFALFFSFLLVILCLALWWGDVIHESVYEGKHTAVVRAGLRMGMRLFIVSEVMFFVSFFWAYLHHALSPSIFIGAVWPPRGIMPYYVVSDVFVDFSSELEPEFSDLLIPFFGLGALGGYDVVSSQTYDLFFVADFILLFFHIDSVLSSSFFDGWLAGETMAWLLSPDSNFATLRPFWNPFVIPLAMTLILITSGVTVTAAHVSIRCANYSQSHDALVLTLFLAVVFLFLQFFEYVNCPFSINTSSFGSIFFLTTGFHGLHVLIGGIFLAVCLARLTLNHILSDSHVGVEAAIWYWHFVDVVWILLYALFYVWATPPELAVYFFFNVL